MWLAVDYILTWTTSDIKYLEETQSTLVRAFENQDIILENNRKSVIKIKSE